MFLSKIFIIYLFYKKGKCAVIRIHVCHIFNKQDIFLKLISFYTHLVEVYKDRIAITVELKIKMSCKYYITKQLVIQIKRMVRLRKGTA